MTNGFAADVLICGAGAAGLTLAIELARRGISFRLVEKRGEPFHGSRGKGIQPRTQEIFEDLGILDKVAATGGTYPPLRVYRDDGGWTEKDNLERQDPTPSEPYHLALMIPQFLTERIMRERLAELGHEVEFGCELAGFEQGGNGVEARLAGPDGEETVHARYLVGADGGRSFVRHALGVAFPGKTLGVHAIVADVGLSGLKRDAWHQFNDGDTERMVAICPLAGTDLFQIQAPVPPDRAVDLSAEGLGLMVGERTGRHDIQVHSVAWASAYAMNARLADRYRVGRVFLVGDAAHIHPPTGGQGRPPCFGARTVNCWTPTRRNGARSRHRCSGFRSACSMRKSRAGCGAAARCASSISAIRVRRFPCNCPNATEACAPGTARRMPRSGVRRASRPGSSSCSGASIGRCSSTTPGSGRSPPARGCISTISARKAISSTPGVISAMPTNWHRASAC